MDEPLKIPGPFTIDEMLTRQAAYELSRRAGKFRYDHLDTGWTFEQLLEMKELFKRLDDD